MKAKITILTIAMLICAMIFTSCKAGAPAYNLELDPATGKGTATYTIRVPKNTAPECGNNFDKEGEEGYIKSTDALLTLFKSSVPSGFTVAMTDEVKMYTPDGEDEEKDGGNFVYTIKFTFTGINDYNAKILSLVGQKNFDTIKGVEGEEIAKATLTYTEKSGKYEAVFTEDTRIIDVVSEWAVQVLTTDKTGVFKDLFKDTNPAAFANMINLDSSDCKYIIKYAGNEEEFQRISNGEVITLKATVDAIPDSKTEVTTTKKDDDDKSPSTGDSANILFPSLIALLTLAAVVLFLSKVKVK